MSEKLRQPLIEQEYERITEEMSGGGLLFGERIDIGDLKQMVVGAYYMGTREAERRYGTWRELDRQLDKAAGKGE